MAMKVVRLNGNYKTNFEGEICGFEEAEANYLLTTKFVKGTKAGEPFAHPYTPPAPKK